MKNFKKPLLIGLIVLDLGLTIFLFVISIIMLSTMVGSATTAEAIANSDGLIQYLIIDTSEGGFLYLGAFVIPLFVLLAANIVGLVIYVRKTTKREPAKLQDLSDEQKEALRQELLKDLQSGDKKE